jgi:hypothetical protein
MVVDHAKSLVKEVDAKGGYDALKRASEQLVVRREWTTSAVHSYEPFYFEVLRMKAGKKLSAEPRVPKPGVRCYGFDDGGRLIVELEQTEFPELVYETFYRHKAAGIERFYYSYDPEKPWLSVAWMPIGPTGILGVHAVFARGNSVSTSFRYDSAGRVTSIERIGSNPPFGELNDYWDIEYISGGNTIRMYHRLPNGRRQLHLEGPTTKTLRP